MEGDASGTAAYMSPQQMQGQTATPSDDLYALGATLYDLLSTQPPFHDGDVVHLVQEAPAPTLHQRFEQLGLSNPLPDHVHNAIMACLAKDPTQRPADAATFGQLIHPNIAPPPVPPEFQPEAESVLAEPIEKTQRYLEKNLPQPVTSWWSAQSTGKQQFLAIASIVIGLMIAEMAYSKLANKGFLKTIRQHHPFLPWHVEPAKRGK
jgi:serine/threonine protein kinase